MSRTLRIGLLACSLLAVAAPGPQAQGRADARATSGFDRIFLGFAEDATIVDQQWWEGRLAYADYDAVDILVLEGVVAFNPWDNIEVGGRIGFGESDTPPGVPDGSGATDLDIWGKYYLGGQGDHADLAVGILGTVPTGDDTAGLGTDAFGLGFFGSARFRLPRAIVSAHGGFRINGDGSVFGSPDLDGETSARLGAAVIFPASDRLSLVGEALYEGERFEGTDSDFRVLAGGNWRLAGRNLLRVAVTGGISDGAPDWEILVGYAGQFP